MDVTVQIIVAVFMVLAIVLMVNVLVLMSTKEVIVPKVRTFSFARLSLFPAAKHMFKVNNRNNRGKCEICSKLTLNTFQPMFYCFYC